MTKREYQRLKMLLKNGKLLWYIEDYERNSLSSIVKVSLDGDLIRIVRPSPNSSGKYERITIHRKRVRYFSVVNSPLWPIQRP